MAYISILALFLFSLSFCVTPSDMPGNSWLSVANTPMRAVAPTNGQFAGTWGASGPAAVITAWGGGAFDTKGNRLILWGGGHGDYYGNELYAFSVSTLSWRRLTDPSINPATANCVINSDGTPTSRHTYNQVAYISHANCFFNMGGGTCGNPFSSNITWVFDLVTNKWVNRNPTPPPNSSYASNCSYDSVSKKVWFGSAAKSFDGLWDYDYDQNKWTQHNQDDFYYYTSALDTKRGILVCVGSSSGNLVAYNVRSGNFTKLAWTTTGGDALIANANPGLDYDPVADRIVGWSGGAVYALDLDTKIWTSYNPSGAPARTSNGIYGRWRYVPSVDAFVLVTDIDQNVYFYKMPAGTAVQGAGAQNRAFGALSFSVTPNPAVASTVITVKGLQASSSVKLGVYDLQGQLVEDLSAGLRGDFGETVWSAKRFPPGVYMVRLAQGKQNLVRLITVMR